MSSTAEIERPTATQVARAERTARAPRPTLRYAAPDDEAFLFDLFVAVRGPVISRIQPARATLLLEQQYRARMANWIALHPRADHHVIEFASNPIGLLCVDRSQHRLVIVDLTIHPDYQGFGVGSWLVEGLVDEAEYLGHPVEVRLPIGHRAEPWFRRLGFRLIGGDVGQSILVRRPAG